MGLLAALLAVLVAMCWGGNFAASKFMLLHFPPFFSIFLRYAIVVVLLLPFARRMTLTWKQLLILSFLLISLHFTLIFTAIWMELELTTAVVAIQLGVPLTCVLGAIFLSDKLGAWRSVGLAIAFTGMVVVAGTPNVAEHELAFSIAVLGALAWAASNIYMKTIGEQPVLPLLFWTGLLSLPQTALVSWIVEGGHIELLLTAPYYAWGGLLYSAIASTIIGYGLWYRLIRTYTVSEVTPFSLLIPIAGFGSGIFFFNEVLTLQMIVGSAITVTGVAIITLRKPKLSRPDSV